MSSRYAATEVSWPGHRATVLVALACTGRILMLSIAGKDRNEPPPGNGVQHTGQKRGYGKPKPVPVQVRGKAGEMDHLNLILEGDRRSWRERIRSMGTSKQKTPGVMPLLWTIFHEEQLWSDPHHPSGQNM
jgi:hypothetical protein